MTDYSTATHEAALNPALFRRFCQIAHEQAGLRLKEGKEALVSARVSKRVRKLGLPSMRSYLAYLESDANGGEITHFVDVITTNFTRFFREPEHFEDLQRFVQRRAEAGQQRFRFWCAAASTGEEPYSMAMALMGLVQRYPIDFRILATDISTKALAAACRGVYPGKALAEVSLRDRQKFFAAHEEAGAQETRWAVRPEVRARVVFDRVNLAQPPFPMKGPLDVVFCRNVMIYLDAQITTNLVAEIERLLRPGGLLVVGHAETLTGIRSNLRPMRPSLYEK